MYNRVLGIDYGLARVGLALSYGTLAEPLEILRHSERLIPDIQERVRQHGVDAIVVGLSENTMAQQTREFAKKLEDALDCPVILHDETLSSAEVQRLLRERSKGKRQYRGPIDHFAASVILQRFLDDTPPNLG